MWTGRPSAEASSWLSPVMMQQEKSRALEMTAERAARSSVFDISRTMPSSRLAITVMSTGSRCLLVPGGVWLWLAAMAVRPSCLTISEM